jgi:hypothetical protein
VTDTIVSLGLALNSAAWIAALWESLDRRVAPKAGVLGRHGGLVALAGMLGQLSFAGVVLGAVEGAAVVLAAWMVLGAALVSCVSVSPPRILATARLLGGLGALLAAGAWAGG